MQFDRTRIAVRERGFIDTLDLALHVLRSFGPRLIGLFAVMIVPLAILNYFLTAWIYDPESALETSFFSSEEDIRLSLAFRYAWSHAVLVFLEAPAAGWLATAYLGDAVFDRSRTLREIVRDLRPVALQLVWCQLILRGTLFALILPLFGNKEEMNPFTEILLPLGLIVLAGIFRATRPFVNEIIILERNPFRSRRPGEITLSQRSGDLQNSASGDLFAQFLASIVVTAALGFAILYSSLIAYQVMSGDDEQFSFVPLHILYPAALWIVVAFFTVVRFLSYLDLRIRQEGWEVELLLRAETNRLQENLI